MSKQTAASPQTNVNAPHDATLEALSSLMDGELEAGRCTGLLQQLCTDAHVRRQWTLMHLTGDALRSSEVASLHSESFVARLSSALEAEPAIVAPHARKSRRFMRRVVLPGAAVAAAASVLVFVAVPQLRGTDSASATMAASKSATTPVLAVGEPAAGAATSTNGAVVIRLPELDAYLAAHREQAGTAVALRSAPYLRTSASVPR